MEQLLKPMEVAKILGVSKATCYRLLEKGTIPSVRFGGNVRVAAGDLDVWLRERKAESAQQQGETPEAAYYRVRRR